MTDKTIVVKVFVKSMGADNNPSITTKNMINFAGGSMFYFIKIKK